MNSPAFFYHMSTGTRERFRQWLQVVKSMTYSKYSKLPTEEKRALYRVYSGQVPMRID